VNPGRREVREKRTVPRRNQSERGKGPPEQQRGNKKGGGSPTLKRPHRLGRDSISPCSGGIGHSRNLIL